MISIIAKEQDQDVKVSVCGACTLCEFAALAKALSEIFKTNVGRELNEKEKADLIKVLTETI